MITIKPYESQGIGFDADSLAVSDVSLHTDSHECRTFHANPVDHFSGGLPAAAIQPDNALAKNSN